MQNDEQELRKKETNSSYLPLLIDDDDSFSSREVHRTLWNFTKMSILFSANHGCVVACLGLASARLGSVGAWQSGILYICYTLSALLGSTYIVKRFGARNALVAGMTLYCAYVGCFVIAIQEDNVERQQFAAYTGATIGGFGAGFLWTAQGAYFSQASEEHARFAKQPVSASTSALAGIFAFWYLAEEVCLRLVSTVLLQFHWASWEGIFGVYTAVTLVSAIAMLLGVHDYPRSDDNESSSDHDDIKTASSSSSSSMWYKVTAAGQLLFRDPKMKYFIGMNAAFGFSSAFLNSYVNGEVIPTALNDPESKYIGILTSWGSAVAAVTSLWFGKISGRTGNSNIKGPILIVGACCFFGVAAPFVLIPDAQQWGWIALIIVYSLMGIGRATFEGTLKATFADYFSYEKEGAFANITLQSGTSSAIGYMLTSTLPCDTISRYCVQFRDGSQQYILTSELVVMASSILAIFGSWRASTLYHKERLVEMMEEENDSER